MYYSQGFKYEDYAPTMGDLAQARYPIFNDWWSTYVPEYRKTLEQKILHTFWFNQIGQETPDKFAFMLNAKLERIMPYYNQLYKSELIKIDPILNHYLETDTNTIEDLVREANTGTTKAAKAIRDFVTNGSSSGSATTDFSGDYTRVLDRDEVTDYTKDGTEDKVKNTTIDEREVTDRDTNTTTHQTGSSETDETSSTTTSGTKSYADTPQRSVDTGSILANYLTNYTYTTGTENSERHSETDTTLDETRNEAMDQTVTTDHSEREVQDNEWHEEGHEEKATDEKETSGSAEGTTQTSLSNSYRADRDDTAQSEASEVKEDEKERTDTTRNDVAKGFMNVSASQLLNQFRETFLNIDDLILEELRPLFMEIF